ncbi:MAG: sigma-E processing peptidase SpoIIGA [Christensenellaceae bacterium]
MTIFTACLLLASVPLTLIVPLQLCSLRIRWGRIAGTSLLGICLYALCLVRPISGVAGLFRQIAIELCLTLLSSDSKNGRQNGFLILVRSGFLLLLGGFAAWIPSSSLPVVLLISFAASLLIAFLLRRGEQRQAKIARFLYPIKLTVGERTIEGKGFLDTGNRVRYRGAPVFILSKELFASVIREKGRDAPCGTLFLMTATGKATLPVLTLDSLVIYSGDEPHRIEHPAITYSREPLAGCDLLFSPDCLNGGRNAPETAVTMDLTKARSE